MILEDLHLWGQASETAQHQAVKDFIQHNALDKHFEFISIETFSCAALQHRIGVFKHITTGMIFHLLPGCTHFQAGLDEQQYEYVSNHYSMDLPEYFPTNELDENGEHVRQSVTVPPMLISRFAITESVWIAHKGMRLHRQFGDDHPIDAVKRHAVQSWAMRLDLSLPSNIEWEYACRAGSNTLFYWGNEPNPDYALQERHKDAMDGYRTFTEAEQGPANAFGLLGMIGNQAEWVLDDVPDYPAPLQAYPLILGMEDDGLDGILRGGWHDYGWSFNRATSRIQCGAADSGCSGRLVFRLADHKARQ
ncbi:formylglycine-generating enzyme family protein [Pseudoalteromonas luteoviolacea]|uniref:Sulfatase-modifying factor enzyme-like domain-containing protein n=1 Tax=Pseudoalteromonas luteoviolacea S4054 TaxID=1129367 RepID=A0A0F6A4I3_9GAMM|nr:SUMF1/EgtB/PvdO family nonheme iron enzyme [Pseudoalteromonas luteoviolacea]AOT11085.1 hypothetical protein S4054249_24950 [Pseudoalteromonas luteoviolacea]AOT15751.1 hypothetical protein S40542_23560 [Pseudoalteromonas luteoviolacea]AOT20906.1 hypothetical protein S4054_24870 [Pseudoalteromonas luteoviolacea]KKE80978.1 hypothetical protein N479_24020 [Pseudoalteromonas luteoviolacea S4054]KZN74561.1 hypothetical protein N481_09055 [Pseudoalteromonas luteoviolacea S4047-1]